MTPTGVGYGDSAGREGRGLSTPGELGVYGGSYTPDILGVYSVSTLRKLSESKRILHSGCSRSLRGFYTPDILGDYGDSVLRIFSEFTGFLHSGCSRSLRGFYTPDILGDYGDSILRIFSESTPRGCETKTRAVDLGRERVGEGVEITHGVFKFVWFVFCFFRLLDLFSQLIEIGGPWLLASQWVCLPKA